MGIAKGLIDYSSDLINYAKQKYRTPTRTPPYIVAEIDDYPSWDQMWYNMEEERRQEAARRISWIYSNITRISNEVSSTPFNIVRKGTRERDIDHPLEAIMAAPNAFFDGTSLLRYTIWGLMLSEDGAYWYIMPDGSGGIKELWPFPIGRLKPIKDKGKFISHYEYTPKGHGEPIKIRQEFVCRFFFSHPDDLWKSLTPLSAAGLSISIYESVSTNIRDTFKQGRGVPLSIISVSPNVSEPDFDVITQRLREDWESERRIAIIRGGDLDAKMVGISNADMEVSNIRQMNRDEIDSIFMGFPWRSDRLASGNGLKESNKQIKETVIYPLHRMIAGQIQISIVEPFYGSGFIGSFDDVRAQDRSLAIQEATIYWSAYTFDEARAERGLPPVTPVEGMDDYGNLPLRLATNPAFVTKYYGVGSVRDPGDKPAEVGNIALSQDQEQLMNDLSGDEPDIDVQATLEEGTKADLRRYRSVLLKIWKSAESTDALLSRGFETSAVPPSLMADIKAGLLFVNSEDDIKAIFSPLLGG